MTVIARMSAPRIEWRAALTGVWIVAALAFSLPIAAPAQPATLKLAFVSSDRALVYRSLVQPFVEAVNSEGVDIVKIEVYFSGALGPVPARQPQLVVDGTADIGFVIPGLSPERFLDNGAVELPGLFRDTREASLVHTRLVAANALRGYEDFLVIGTVATQPETIHSRKHIASLADLKGQKLRVNNPTAATAMARLGASSSVLPLNNTANAISSGAVDGAVVQLAQLFDYGIARLVSHHYLLPGGSAPLALVMNRKVFDGLPAHAQAIIRKYSGEWVAARYAEISDAMSTQALVQIKADKRRTVTVPTPAEQAAAAAIFDTIAKEWAATSPHNRALLALVRSEIATLRSPKEIQR